MEKQTAYWLTSAQHDLEVAESLFQAGKYDWCLFIGHLVLEKALKAWYVKTTNDFPPRIHDLVRLADLAKVTFEDETLDFLDSVNTFNIAARYPDEKFRFYKLCTHEFTKTNFQRIKEIYQWIYQEITTSKK